ncbi:hypothetical protein EDB83DRAFT_2327241 [Lactarius deliciosus]|nr:hypothetical protein EDB83DRAFT_2327241 [Lactarius deliciosus]
MFDVSHWMRLVPRPSKTRAMENAPWRRLKPKTYPRVPKSAATDACTTGTKVNVPPPKKKRRSNTDTFSTAADSELPVEDPNDEGTNEVPRRQAHTDNSCMVPPHLERCQKALTHSSEDKSGPEDKSQDDDNEEDEDNEDLFRLDNEALRQMFDDEAVGWAHNDLPSIPSLMGHLTGRTPHDSWANRHRLMSQIFPEFMDHPTSVRSIFDPERYLSMENM